jgi:hypothetical protein
VPRVTRWIFVLAGVSLALLASVRPGRSAMVASAASPFEPTEIEVKAAFLYHFAQLVTWPDAEITASDSKPIVVAVVGRDPFGRRLEAIIGRESVRGRPIKIERAARVADLAALPHILYVGATDRAEVEASLAAVAGSPVLTVSAMKGFAEAGGMVEFRVTPDARVAFDINLRAVEEARLKMSSQLLKIARIVEKRP